MSTSRVAWLQLSAGVAGDMVLGALIGAGADLDDIRHGLSSLDVPGWSLTTEPVDRCGIVATRAIVEVDDDATSRPYGVIRSLLEAADLAPRVKQRSQRAFRLLAETEAALHGPAIDDVHFHEVGGHDAIVDVVGVMLALESLEIDTVTCSRIGLGHGPIRAAHGIIPGPAPATARLLTGFAVDGVDQPVELATPTGAALVASLCEAPGPVPPMTLRSHGLGAGTRDLPDVANVVGAFIGDAPNATIEPVALLETTVDDVTGEHLALCVSAVLEAGALDAWVTPVTMKKGRPGHVLSCLCDPVAIASLTTVIHRTTGSLGVRTTLLERSTLPRRFVSVEVAGHEIAIKVSPVRAKPELDDVARVAQATGMTLAEVDAASLAAFEELAED